MGRTAILFLRLLRQTLFPRWPTGPRNPRRLLLLTLLVPLFLFLQVVHWVGFLLDEVLFPGYRRVKIQEPLFIVGLPRSGTSFLQRVLARDTERFTTLRLWELLLAPSISERKLLHGLAALDRLVGSPFQRLAGWGGRKGLAWLDVIHEVSLNDPEEDYFLLLPVFACFLLVVPFPYHEAIWKLARFDELPARDRKPIMDFYVGALKRHLYTVGPDKRLLSKNPSFTPFLKSLDETFPDGHFLFCVRHPLKVVPSLLSSVGVGARFFGYDVSEARIRDRFVEMLVYFVQHAQEVLDAIPTQRHAFAPLEVMREDVRGFVLRIYDQFGWEADPRFLARLAEESRRGKRHKSAHAYSLAEFGLDEATILRVFQGFISRFGFASEDPDGLGTDSEPEGPWEAGPPSPGSEDGR